MTSTTRPMLTAMVNWTSPTDALIVWVRSPSTCSLIEGGSERCRLGSTSLTRCTVSLMLNPGCLCTSMMTARSPSTQAACRISSTPSIALPTSRIRTGAPLRYAMMTESKAAASKIWSVASKVRDCLGPSSVPFGASTVAVPIAARMSSRLIPIADTTVGLI